MISGKSFERFFAREILQYFRTRNDDFQSIEICCSTVTKLRPVNVIIIGDKKKCKVCPWYGCSHHTWYQWSRRFIFKCKWILQLLCKCYLNLGNYGGHELISSGTVRYYTARDGELMRRGMVLIFRNLVPISILIFSTLASPKTFGHQGFTGAHAWVDPDQEIMYIFLSNRTFPDSSQNKLHKNRYRTKIQDSIYNSILPWHDSACLYSCQIYHFEKKNHLRWSTG